MIRGYGIESLELDARTWWESVEQGGNTGRFYEMSFKKSYGLP